jgi:hypothetical protein
VLTALVMLLTVALCIMVRVAIHAVRQARAARAELDELRRSTAEAAARRYAEQEAARAARVNALVSKLEGAGLEVVRVSPGAELPDQLARIIHLPKRSTH